MEIALMVLPLA